MHIDVHPKYKPPSNGPNNFSNQTPQPLNPIQQYINKLEFPIINPYHPGYNKNQHRRIPPGNPPKKKSPPVGLDAQLLLEYYPKQIVIVGDKNCGKSSLIRTYLQDQITGTQDEIRPKQIQTYKFRVNGCLRQKCTRKFQDYIDFIIYDTPGRYSITNFVQIPGNRPNFWIICFSLMDQKSFQYAQKIRKNLEQNKIYDYICVGTKGDEYSIVVKKIQQLYKKIEYKKYNQLDKTAEEKQIVELEKAIINYHQLQRLSNQKKNYYLCSSQYNMNVNHIFYHVVRILRSHCYDKNEAVSVSKLNQICYRIYGINSFEEYRQNLQKKPLQNFYQDFRETWDNNFAKIKKLEQLPANTKTYQIIIFGSAKSGKTSLAQKLAMCGNQTDFVALYKQIYKHPQTKQQSIINVYDFVGPRQKQCDNGWQINYMGKLFKNNNNIIIICLQLLTNQTSSYQIYCQLYKTLKSKFPHIPVIIVINRLDNLSRKLEEVKQYGSYIKDLAQIELRFKEMGIPFYYHLYENKQIRQLHQYLGRESISTDKLKLQMFKIIENKNYNCSQNLRLYQPVSQKQQQICSIF